MKTLYFISALLLAVPVQAQTDSITTTYSQESIQRDTIRQRSGSRFLAAYRKFVRAQIEETTLIKIGGWPIGLVASDSGGIGPGWGFVGDIAVEQKLTPAFSFLLLCKTFYQHSTSESERVTINGVLTGRWYYAMNRRMRQGRSANNFSDQYVTLQTSLPIWSRVRSNDPANIITENISNSWVGVAWGGQRRLGKLAYLDVNFGVGYPFDKPKSIVLTGNVSIGLGL